MGRLILTRPPPRPRRPRVYDRLVLIGLMSRPPSPSRPPCSSPPSGSLMVLEVMMLTLSDR